MKKILSLVVVLVLVLSLSATGLAATMKYAVTFPSAGTPTTSPTLPSA